MKVIKDYAPIITISISLLALLISGLNARISKKSYRVNKQQFKNKLSKFDFYLIDSHCISIENERLLLFHITVTNKSETKNSFTPSLILEYYNSENYSMKMRLQHNPNLSEKIVNHSFTYYSRDIFLSDKESISKWLIFGYNIEITKGKRIDNYTLNLRDVNNNQVEVSSFLMKELI